MENRQLYTQENKRHLSNIVLCFHGCVLARADALIFREHINDMQSQIIDLVNSGYTFVPPSQYDDWYDGTVPNPNPLAVIHLDDGLDSIIPFCNWLIARNLPFGLAIISSRQRKFTPQQGFLTWAKIREYVESGLCEILRHTHNIHNLTIFDVGGSAGPVLEGPCWLDDPADFQYLKAGDTRWYWDFDIIDSITWGFPLFGSDPYSGFTTAINSHIYFKAQNTLTVNVIRFWCALHRPYGAGYDCQINVKVDGVSIGIYTISPKVYETRTQWVEREFYSLTLTTPFDIVTGTDYDLSFETLNTGNGAFIIYALPEPDDNSYRMTTTSVSFTEDKIGPNYSDFPAGRDWPARACIILASGSGRQATDVEYSDYIEADIVAQNNAIEDWLKADWYEHITPYKTTREEWSLFCLAGTNEDGTTVTSMIQWTAVRPVGYSPTATTMSIESLTLKQGKPIGLRYALLVRVEISTGSNGPWTFVGHWVPGWDYYKWLSFDINPTTVTIGATYWFRFTTLTRSYNADYPLVDDPDRPGNQIPGTNLGKIAIYLDTPYMRTVVKEFHSKDQYGNDINYYLFVSKNGQNYSRLVADKTLLAPDGGYSDPFYPGFRLDWTGIYYWVYYLYPAWNDYGSFQAWTSTNDGTCNLFWEQYPDSISPYDPSTIWFYEPDGSVLERFVHTSKTGQTSLYGGEVSQTFYAGFGNTLFGARAAVHNPSGITYNQMIYPFGSYFQEGSLTADIKPVADINAILSALFTAYSIRSGYTIWPSRNDAQSVFRETFCRCTTHTKSRVLLYGDIPQLSSRSLIANYTGLRWEDAKHGGLKWQMSIEADQFGNATVRNSYSCLHTVAFDAWFFKVPDIDHAAGWIMQDAINDGGTWDSIVYYDDKTFLQDRGILCTLILSNFDPLTGEPSPSIASYVVNHPSEFITDIVSIATTYNWDGITCNLEAIPQADRAAATNFYQLLGTAMRAAGKQLHITAPALTNTDYDIGSEFWWGWCDHGAIIGYVDRMKIMTYTETGPGTPPGPHAPDFFINAAYEYLKTIIHPVHYKRILIGCNSFGHLWHDSTGTLPVDYISYHEGIQNAITSGAEIKFFDGEATYKHGNDEAWWGTPKTINRAIDIAVKHGFGGIGMWKGDDGDIFEHFPKWTQLGVYKDMTFIDMRLPSKFRYGFIGGPRMDTNIGNSDSQYVQAVGIGDSFVREYKGTMFSTTKADIDQLQAFFMIARAERHTWRFSDPNDYTATDANIGTGNASTLIFQMRKQYVFGAFTEQRTITKPVSGTVVVKLNGVTKTETTDYSINYSTGVITFVVAPGSGVVITASFEFDVHVRWGVNWFAVTSADVNLWDMQGLRIVEDISA